MSTITDLMQERLEQLKPLSLDIRDDSSQSSGHEGAKGGGGHYWLSIVAQAFSGKARIQRHRLIYSALGDLMQQKIHALSIEAFSPEEV